MNDYNEWATRHPHAALELRQILTAQASVQHPGGDGRSEAWAQQQVRMQIARAGGMAWRNNVGATKAKEAHTCPRCSFKYETKNPPIRWGLCNDSMQLNAKFKSADLIGIIPRLITPAMVGQTIGQFGSFEVKEPGWTYTGNEHEAAQLAWGELVGGLGAYACFTTGVVEL